MAKDKVKAQAKKTVSKRKEKKKAKGSPKIPEVKTEGLLVMKAHEVDAYLESLDKDEVKLMGAEAKIYEKAKEATNAYNQIAQNIGLLSSQLSEMKAQQLKLQGRQAGYLNVLIEIEDERRAANAKSRSS